jgi:tripartite-type tricarboxylate transporter receptor subunit TctC
MHLNRRRIVSIGAAAALAGTPLAASSQPAKTLRIIVPFAAGGADRRHRRLIAEKAKDTLGNIVIENKPGAGGGIGVDMVAKAAPDGQTLGIAAVAMHAINPWLFARSCPTTRSRTSRRSRRWCASPTCW